MTKQKLVSLIKEVIQEQTEPSNDISGALVLSAEQFAKISPNNFKVFPHAGHFHAYVIVSGRKVIAPDIISADKGPIGAVGQDPNDAKTALLDLINAAKSKVQAADTPSARPQTPAVQRRGPESERRDPRRGRSDYKNDPLYIDARADYLRAIERVKEYNQQSDSLTYKQELTALKSAKRDALASFEAFRKLLEKYPNVKIDYLVKFSNDKVVRLQPKDPKETLNHYKKNIRTISKVLIELEDRSKRRRRYRRARPIFLRKFRKYKQPFKDRYKGLNKDAFDKFYLDLEAKDLGFLLGKRGRDYQFGKKHEFAFRTLLKSGTPNMIDISPVIIRTA